MCVKYVYGTVRARVLVLDPALGDQCQGSACDKMKAVVWNFRVREGVPGGRLLEGPVWDWIALCWPNVEFFCGPITGAESFSWGDSIRCHLCSWDAEEAILVSLFFWIRLPIQKWLAYIQRDPLGAVQSCLSEREQKFLSFWMQHMLLCCGWMDGGGDLVDIYWAIPYLLLLFLWILWIKYMIGNWCRLKYPCMHSYIWWFWHYRSNYKAILLSPYVKRFKQLY